MTTATVTARDLFPFVTEGDTLTVRDGTEYVVAGDEHAGQYFLRAGAFDAQVRPTEDDTDFARWCSSYAPTPAHEEELEAILREQDADVEAAVDADIKAFAAEAERQGCLYAIVDADIDAIVDVHWVRPAFVAGRARVLDIPVLR